MSESGIRFDHIYIRNLNNNSLSFDITNFFIELVNYVRLTSDYNALLFWLNPKLLFKLLKTGGKVIGVNNKVNNWLKIGTSNAQVLWPDPNLSLPTIDLGAFLSGYTVILTHIRRLISLYSEVLFTNRKDNILTYLSEIQIPFDEEIKESLIREIIKLYDDKKFKKERSRLSNWENKLSIVFSIDDKLLMCGDATKASIKKALASKTNVNFNIIKVPHHGTTKYASRLIFQSNSTFLVPNSKLSGTKYIDLNYCVNPICECLNHSFTKACRKTCSKKDKLIINYKKYTF